MSGEELKPCPFCGTQPVLSVSRIPRSTGFLVHCGCGIAREAVGSDLDERQTRSRLIAAWNRRSEPHPAAEGWRDMDSAPRDATEIIGLLGRKTIRLIWWFAPSSRTEGWLDESGNEVAPVAWAPIPVSATCKESLQVRPRPAPAAEGERWEGKPQLTPRHIELLRRGVTYSRIGLSDNAGRQLSEVAALRELRDMGLAEILHEPGLPGPPRPSSWVITEAGRQALASLGEG